MSVVTTVWVRMFFRSFSHARAEPRCSVPAEWWRYYPATKRTAHMTSSLWQPFTLGNVELPHRLALAPLTRSRANPDGTPGELAAEYYGQRASLGLIITEGTQPSEDGQGYLTADRWRTGPGLSSRSPARWPRRSGQTGPAFA